MFYVRLRVLLIGLSFFFFSHCVVVQAQDGANKLTKEQLPALLPFPKQVEWDANGRLYQFDDEVGVVLTADSIQSLFPHLQELLAINGVTGRLADKGAITMEVLSRSELSNANEGYRIKVSDDGLRLQATSKRGLFYALQTLKQLFVGERGLPYCFIEDAPAFSWRGYLVDVGRNYQDMEMLKQQINTMASLKLNLFHFHVTEDIAWRLQSDRYPQLTDSKHMIRHQGSYYTTEEIKELQRYCADRYITFMMEIDMPGHSAAFRRAIGHDMQSPEGLEVVLDILDEVTTTYDFDIFHIGADEVKITNPDFVPTVTRFLQERGLTVVGWQPGGNYPKTVWRQLWHGDVDDEGEEGSVQVDSRNLYINHMDALETVPLIFNHQVCDVDAETPTKKGSTLCLWNDRHLASGRDNLTHNAVYPALFAFADKVWRGGGKVGHYVGVDQDPKALAGLRDLEYRMMAVHAKHHAELNFPYRPQADIEWRVFGPYDNGGDLSARFLPEKVSATYALVPDTTLVGGTIIWRHFWSPTVKGHYTDLSENSTFYAHRSIWSDEEREAEMWIGFYDFSTSTATDTPKEGTWNNLHSQIWLNGTEIAPPAWTRAGETGDLEIPYIDENYIMRAPHKVKLKKGWNNILVKCPVGKFNSGIWYAPHKWMFTAVLLDE